MGGHARRHLGPLIGQDARENSAGFGARVHGKAIGIEGGDEGFVIVHGCGV